METTEQTSGKQIDLLSVGPVSLDTNVSFDGKEEKNLGGAIIYGGWAAAQCGFKTVIVTTANASECDVAEGFYGSGVTLTVLPSAHTCAIRNVYLSADKERRVSTNTHRADPIRFSDIEDLALTTRAIQLGGLVAGDFEEDILPKLHALKQCYSDQAQTTPLGVITYPIIGIDAQGLLRTVEPDGSMRFHPWKAMETLLPFVDVLKTDAAEAEYLTGLSDRYEAAKVLCDMGAREVMVTHNSEVIVCGHFGARDLSFVKAPLVPRNLSGRTGRGDTTFAGYLAMRSTHTAQEAVLFAAALVSKKMETPGPYHGSKDDILSYIHCFYD